MRTARTISLIVLKQLNTQGHPKLQFQLKKGDF